MNIRYTAELLPDGHLSVPPRLKKILNLNGNDKLEIIISKKENNLNRNGNNEKIGSIFSLKFDMPGLLSKIKELNGSTLPEDVIYKNRR